MSNSVKLDRIVLSLILPVFEHRNLTKCLFPHGKGTGLGRVNVLGSISKITIDAGGRESSLGNNREALKSCLNCAKLLLFFLFGCHRNVPVRVSHR